VSRALEQIGIRPSQRSRRVGDYELQNLIEEGPYYQDFLGKHVALKDTFRRIRIYLVQAETNPEQRVMVQLFCFNGFGTKLRAGLSNRLLTGKWQRRLPQL
jgi:hypothetical protein